MVEHDVYAVCDRCGKDIKENEYIPLNAIPRGGKMSIPFEIRMQSDWATMQTLRFCPECVQSFYEWWEMSGKCEGDDQK